ncbi:MAG: DUF2007 domain-containing protein [Bacteroidota bacterium]
MSETFVTVAQFTYSSEAQIIRGKLESEGIPVFMADDLTIDIDPLVSNALGGVRLRVYSEDEERAREILDTIRPFSVDEKGKEIHCPNCNSSRIHYFSHVNSIKSLVAFLFGFLFSTLPFYTKYDYTCEVCKTKFVLDE